MPEKHERRFSVRDVLKVYAVPLERHWFAAACTVGGMIAVTVLQVIAPLYYKQLLDLLAAQSGARIAGPLITILFILLGLNLAGWTFRRIGQFGVVILESKAMNELAQSAFASLLEHSYGFFTNSFTGSLVRRVSRLARSFEDVGDRFLFNVLPLVVSLVGIIFVLFLRSPWLGGIFLAWVVILMTVQVLLARYKLRYSILAAEKDSEATGALSDALSNDTTVKLFTGTAFERDRFNAISDEQERMRYKGWRFDEYVNMTQGFLGLSIEFILMYAAVLLWRDGVLTVGDFVLIQAYILTALEQLWNFGNNIRRIYEAFADATEMVDIMNLPREITDAPGAAQLAPRDGTIEFKDVVFAFSDGKPVLSDFNLAITGHEKVALVGPSGAGKTTITKLILRFYDVTGGAIEIDGQNISKVTQDSLRGAIAFVPQEPILFHRTLMENIRYGRRDATDAEVVEAAKQAHCYEFIMRTKDGFDTYVGERGIKLSGGERQRIAIARAILKNAPILILDEATSSLDSESEALIQDALARLMEGKTVIAIAHRLSTVMKMDRIIVIENGAVAMSGTHDELVTHDGGLYQKLWEIQAGGFLADDTEKEGAEGEA
ncbi:MAG TPA: ABC transporter ATP-binding protein [Candidatus Paceibacterota bacterium]